MPYRIKKGQEVILVDKDGVDKPVEFNRTVDFTKSELITSPLDEHQDEGIAGPSYIQFPWGINITGRWDDVGDWVALYAKEVHALAKGFAPKTTNTVVIQGSGTNQYTILLTETGYPKECSCRGYRFKRKACKHMKQIIATL